MDETRATEPITPQGGGGRLLLGRYRLRRRLGAGGFGTVWEAHDERLDRPVAVKRVPLEEGGGHERARREALAAARLSHPGVVALYEADAEGDAFLLVSELVRGQTLGALQREGALSDRDVLEIGAALCEALAHAHARGVIHRDVKPGNVMVADDGAAKLADFGIARIADHAAITRTGDVVGTLAYMAPEQAEGRSVTGAADLYSLALVLYEALTGTNPVRAEGAAATARRVGLRLPPTGRLRRDLPRELTRALDVALDPQPERRGTLEDLRSALDDASGVVDDEPGIVEPATVALDAPRRALVPLARATRPEREPAPYEPRSRPQWRHGPPPEPLEPVRVPAAPPPRRRAAIPSRVLAGLLAGGSAAWAADRLLGPAVATGTLPEIDPAVVAVAVGGTVALLPRVGVLLATLALALALVPDGGAEPALIVAVVVAPLVLLLPQAGTLWPLPALAPLLGAAGLAGAHPALIGLVPGRRSRLGLEEPRGPALADGLLTRAALGALGAWWLAAAGELTDGGPELAALIEPGVLALAATWAVAAVLLPLLVRGVRLVPDLIGAGLWALFVALATPAAAEAVGADPLSGALAGAVVGAALAVLARAMRVGA